MADGRCGKNGGCTEAGSQMVTGPWAGRSWGKPVQDWDGLDKKQRLIASISLKYNFL